MLKKRESRSTSRRNRTGAAPSPVRFEPLEPRLMMNADCPIIESITADNRGLIQLQVGEQPLFAPTVNANSVRVTTAGADFEFGTSDDIVQDIEVSYTPDDNIIRIVADGVGANERYQVFLDSSLIRGRNGRALDGEFNGPNMPTGDGVAGGDLLFFARRDASPIARFTTNLGVIDVQLFPQTTPASVQNFFNYADSGRYDGTIFHRSVEDFVIQGGGFESDRPFDPIDVDDPVFNEPFLSNTRGTLAYAKRGNDPNSATSQWFFNLGDNSGNLDFQNGGFTVFGEILNDAGLEVMDAIGALMRLNAGSVNPVLGELPVINDNATAGNVDSDDVVIVERLAILMEITDEAPGQIDAESVTFDSGRDARVLVYDLDGRGLSSIESGVHVRFDGNIVRSIVIDSRFEGGSLGIVISGAQSVGSFKDARPADAADLGFIVSNVRIGAIVVTGGIQGANIGGLILGGMLLPDDIDGDGAVDDPTAIYLTEGFSKVVRVDGPVTGDIVIPNGVNTLVLRGGVSNSDIMLGELDDVAPTVIDLGPVRDVDLVSDSPISVLKVVDWQDDDATPDRIRAPIADKIVVTGDRRNGLNGDLEADLILTSGSTANQLVLNALVVNGDLLFSDIEATGNVRSIVVRGSVNNVNTQISGSVLQIVAGLVTSTDILINGNVNKIVVGEWYGGELTARTLNLLVTRGDRATQAPGDLAIDLNIFESRQFFDTLGKVVVQGDLVLGTWVVDGDAGTIVTRGDVADMNFDFSFDLDMLIANRVEDTQLSIGTQVTRILADSWSGGGIDSGVIRRFDLTGDRRTGDNGNLENASIRTFRVGVAGIRGDMTNSLFSVSQPTGRADIALEKLHVYGKVDFSEIRLTGDVDSVELGGLHNSSLYGGVATNTTISGFPTASAVNQAATMQFLRITRPASGEEAIIGSFITAGSIVDARLGDVRADNNQVTFGIAVHDVESLYYYRDGTSFNNRVDLFDPFQDAPNEMLYGDFQIRLNFEVPMDAINV
ncbi:MAG: peptidylprolyl isomerase [Planctomycetota bacterium]|nr:peptidylprolyl isomerase [Planctomycetota bacterium]